jgi:hypothetical protein
MIAGDRPGKTPVRMAGFMATTRRRPSSVSVNVFAITTAVQWPGG